MHINAAQTSQTQGRIYRPLRTDKETRASDFRQRPEDLFHTEDIASAGLFGSRGSLRNAINAGRFPSPMRLPSGRLAWRGRSIADWLDQLEAQAAAQ